MACKCVNPKGKLALKPTRGCVLTAQCWCSSGTWEGSVTAHIQTSSALGLMVSSQQQPKSAMVQQEHWFPEGQTGTAGTERSAPWALAPVWML